MAPLINPYRTAQCEVCGNMVPLSNMPEHLLADARILRIIKASNPDWGRRQCEDYLRAMYGPNDYPRAN